MLKIGYFPENVKLDVFKHSYLEKVMVTKVLKFYSDTSKGPRINIEPKNWCTRIFLFRLPAHSAVDIVFLAISAFVSVKEN